MIDTAIVHVTVGLFTANKTAVRFGHKLRLCCIFYMHARICLILLPVWNLTSITRSSSIYWTKDRSATYL